MPVDDNLLEIGQGYQALYHNIMVRRAYGFGVISGGQVTAGSGLSVDVAAVDVLANGNVESASATNLNVSGNSSGDPRKDAVVYDVGAGQLDIIDGTPNPVSSRQSGATQFDTFQPSPPALDTTAYVVLAELWVVDGATSLSSTDINDLRSEPVTVSHEVSLPDDRKIFLGDGDDFSVFYDPARNVTVIQDEGTGNEWVFYSNGDLEIPGDLTVQGTFDPASITPDSIVISNELAVPTYSDNANAVQADSRFWFNDGSGPNAAGYYGYDGGVVGPFETGSGTAPGSLSGLTIDISKDWANYIITGMGHDGVRVPQVRSLTVEDWESGVLDTDVYSGDTGQFSVQSSVVESGSYALSGDAASQNTDYFIYANDGLRAYFQSGDVFEWSTYITDDAGYSILSFGVQSTPSQDSYVVELDDNNEQLVLQIYSGGSGSTLDSVNVDFPLNEWLTATVEWGTDGAIDVTLRDSTGSSIGTVSATDTTFDSGGVGYGVRLAGSSGTNVVYHDSITLKRREPEAAANTQKGVTEAGNELTPSGAVHTGPTEVPADHPNYPVINLPVTDALAAGDPVGYHIALDEDRALTVEGEADGSGGLQQAFVRANFALGLGDTNRQTLSGDLTLTEASAQVQFLDPGGANRNVDLPPEANSLVFIIANTADAAEDLAIRNDAGTTLATVNQDDVAYAVSDGNGWAVFAAPGGAT